MRNRLFLILSAVVIGAAGWQIVEPSQVHAGAECCDTSDDCGGTRICCQPTVLQRNCSPTKVGYCSAGCTQ